MVLIHSKLCSLKLNYLPIFYPLFSEQTKIFLLAWNLSFLGKTNLRFSMATLRLCWIWIVWFNGVARGNLAYNVIKELQNRNFNSFTRFKENLVRVLEKNFNKKSSSAHQNRTDDWIGCQKITQFIGLLYKKLLFKLWIFPPNFQRTHTISLKRLKINFNINKG